MVLGMLWIINLSLPIFFLGLSAFLLKDWIASLDWSSLSPGEVANLLGVGIGVFATTVAIVSLMVTLAQFRQAIKDSEEQQKSLVASRQKLEAVIEVARQQKETLDKSLEVSKKLVGLQEEQQAVLAKSLETTKSLYQIQKEERERILELASRKPKLEAYLGDHLIENGQVTLDVQGDIPNQKIYVFLKNTGSAPVLRPKITAALSRKDLFIHFTGTEFQDPGKEHWSRLYVQQILPFSSSQQPFVNEMVLARLQDLPNTANFDLVYNVVAENLEKPFTIVIHIQFKRS